MQNCQNYSMPSKPSTFSKDENVSSEHNLKRLFPSPSLSSYDADEANHFYNAQIFARRMRFVFTFEQQKPNHQNDVLIILAATADSCHQQDYIHKQFWGKKKVGGRHVLNIIAIAVALKFWNQLQKRDFCMLGSNQCKYWLYVLWGIYKNPKCLFLFWLHKYLSVLACLLYPYIGIN